MGVISKPDQPGKPPADNPLAVAGPALSRRVLIKTGGAFALSAMVPLLSHCGGSSADDSNNGGGASGPTRAARFLDDAQLDTLRALVDRFIPGQPEDLDPGAVAACCAEAIDHLLAAFRSDPPFIYAGAPFSTRGGAAQNDFLAFVRLDAYEELAWRIAIEGSQGRAEREFNGPVKGMQQIYSEGLAQLEQRAQAQGFASFAAMPGFLRDRIIGDGSDALVADMVDIAFPDTLDAMYGPPEYGGNCELLGWGFTRFEGDVQPRGYTDAQVINPDNPGLFDALLPPSYGTPAASTTRDGMPVVRHAADPVQALPAVLAGESMAAAMMAADGSLRRLRVQLQPLARQRMAEWATGWRDA